MPTEKLLILTAAGHDLSGALELPTGLVRGAALFAHCFTCTKQSKAAIAVSRALSMEGIATLRFDFTGLGGSEGEFGRAGFGTDVADLVAAAEVLLERFGGKILLVGHSLGGAAVLAAADELGFDRIAAIATIGAPSDVPHVLHAIYGDLDTIRSKGQGDVTIGGRPFALSREFLERAENNDLLAEVARMRVPLMVMHSPTDAIVGIEHAGRLFDAAKHPKNFVSLYGADHLLLREQDAHFAARMIAGWAQHYLDPLKDVTHPEDGIVVRTGLGKFGTEVHTKIHHFIADEPLSYGGDDTGPTLYDLLLGALGTCTAMTMKMYAAREGISFHGTTIALTHERDHHKDCDHCEEGARIQSIHRTITFDGDLSDEDSARLIQIADRCPVHRTLEGELHIHTKRG
jgi:uncharacterized OsmC-like protein/fermentation-respiration switch protein FrsA (DUF1100 family)